MGITSLWSDPYHLKLQLKYIARNCGHFFLNYKLHAELKKKSTFKTKIECDKH